MDIIQSIILGFIQGVTEWFPVSSTGHLRIAEHYFGLTVPLLFDVMLHFGTLLVTIIFFRNEIESILKALVKRDLKTENGKLILFIIIGTVPTSLIGLFFGNVLDAYFSNIPALGGGFILCGLAIYCSKFGKEAKQDLTFIDALIVGVAQGLAIVPSISRSGLTIAAALLLGIRREKAFKFSFLLSIPSIIGALGLTLFEQNAELGLFGISLTEIFAGVVVSILVSLLTLRLLWRTLAGGRFYLFAFYCLAVGALLIGLSYVGF